MGAIKGRAVLVFRNGTRVAGVRTKSITINGAPIDITADEDDGIRRSVSGVLLNESLRAEALSTSDRIAATVFTYPGFDGSPANTHGFSGEFFLASYSETGEYQGAVTFEATFQSAGQVTYTPE
jgi:predicted secreted protein